MGVLVSVANSVDMSLLGGGGHVIVIPIKPSGVVQGTWTTALAQDHALQHHHYNAVGVAINDEEYYYVMLSQGTYTLLHCGYKDNSQGITKVLLDAVEIASDDMYAAVPAYAQVTETTGIVVTSSKLYKLTVKVTSKNILSSNYNVNYNYLVFIKTA